MNKDNLLHRTLLMFREGQWFAPCIGCYVGGVFVLMLAISVHPWNAMAADGGRQSVAAPGTTTAKERGPELEAELKRWRAKMIREAKAKYQARWGSKPGTRMDPNAPPTMIPGQHVGGIGGGDGDLEVTPLVSCEEICHDLATSQCWDWPDRLRSFVFTDCVNPIQTQCLGWCTN